MRHYLLLFAVLALLLTGVPLTPVLADTSPGRIEAVQGELDAELSSVHGPDTLFPVAEYGKTTIALRVCSAGPQFMLRAENIGKWMTEIFYRTDRVNGCSPSPGSWWRMIYNINPGTGEQFRIYVAAYESRLSEAEFMQRARRYRCTVPAAVQLSCVPETVTAPHLELDEPFAGAELSGTATIRGWAVDKAATDGPGVTDIHVRINGQWAGAATYGEGRPDVGSFLGDSRFAASGYRLTVDTQAFANGPATLRLDYRSALTGVWHTAERGVTIRNGSTPQNLPPNPPPLQEPAQGATSASRVLTLRWADGGDPDNGPRPSRDYEAEIRAASGSWSARRGWDAATNWALTVPADGVYLWRVRAGDGALASGWSAERSLTVSSSSDVLLNVRYVDQVYAQGKPEGTCPNCYWNHCGPASVAMVLHAMGKETRDVLNDRQATLDLVPRVKPTGTGGSNWNLMLGVLRSAGLEVTTFAPNLDRIKDSLKAGRPVIAAINPPDHFIVITGVKANGNLVINDPFGGRFWWTQGGNLRNDWGRSASQPATKGLGVEYAYSELALVLTASVGGAAPVPSAAVAAVGPQGGMLEAGPVRLSFAPAAAALNSTEAISVVLTPTLTPTHSLGEQGVGLTSFSVVGMTGAGQTLATHPGGRYQIAVALDAELVAGWGESGGSVEDGGAPGSGGRAPALDQTLRLAFWDTASESWVLLPTEVDLTGLTVRAETERYGAFALVVARQHTLYLPLLQR